MAVSAYPVYTPASAPGLAQFLDDDTLKVGYLQATKFTLGSVIFAGVGGVLSQNNASFFWDATNKWLGLGTAAPTAKFHLVQEVITTGSPSALLLVGGAHTTLTVAEASDVYLNLNRAVQFSNAGGTVASQRAVRVAAPTYAAAAAMTITDAATVAVSGAPVKSTNVTITRSHGLLIEAGAVSTATAAYGLTVNAPTGGTANYAAAFLGGRVGINTATPEFQLHVEGAGSTTIASGQVIIRGTNSTTNFTVLVIEKVSTASLMLGVNKNSTTGSVPSNCCFISTYATTQPLCIGRGGANDLPSTADIFIDTAGKVGIGTANPGYTVNAYGTAGSVCFALESPAATDVNTGSFVLKEGTNNIWQITKRGSGSTDGVNQLIIERYTGSWAQYLRMDPTTGKIVVGNANTSGGLVTPTAQLEINLTTNVIPLRLNMANTSGYAGIHFGVGTAGGDVKAHCGYAGSATGMGSVGYFGTIAASPMIFTTTDTERVRIAADGKVCVNTVTPSGSALLTVNGTIVGTQATGVTEAVMAGRSISAGTGLSGGGDLTTNRTLSLDQAVNPTWTGAHTFTGGVTFKNHSAFAGSGFIPETRAVQTTTVTPAVLWSKTLADNTLYWIEVRVIGRDVAGVERAYYGRTFYVYRQSAGSATLGNVIELFSEETDADWDVDVNVNTNDVEVKVTGKSSVTINWAGTVTMQAVSGNT
jgi:hypothetical protein